MTTTDAKYKFNQRATEEEALANAQPREVRLAYNTRRMVGKFQDGSNTPFYEGGFVTRYSSRFASLADILASVPEGNKCYIIMDSNISISSNTTIESDVFINILIGSRFLIIGASTVLTLNCGILAPPTDIFFFSSTGSVDFGGNLNNILPEWFGAVGDGTTNDYNAIKKCIRSLTEPSTILFSAKTYLLDTDEGLEFTTNLTILKGNNTTLKLRNDCYLNSKNLSMDGIAIDCLNTVINPASGGFDPIILMEIKNCSFRVPDLITQLTSYLLVLNNTAKVNIENTAFEMTGNATAGNCISGIESDNTSWANSEIVINNCSFNGSRQEALNISGTTFIKVQDCIFSSCGIYDIDLSDYRPSISLLHASSSSASHTWELVSNAIDNTGGSAFNILQNVDQQGLVSISNTTITAMGIDTDSGLTNVNIEGNATDVFLSNIRSSKDLFLASEGNTTVSNCTFEVLQNAYILYTKFCSYNLFENSTSEVFNVTNGIHRISKIGGNLVSFADGWGSIAKGELVKCDTTVTNGIRQAGANDTNILGVAYDVIGESSSGYVVVEGIAEVLIKNSTSVTRGDWIKVSDTAGRAVSHGSASKPSGSVANLDECLKSVGYALESVSAGTDILVKVKLSK